MKRAYLLLIVLLVLAGCKSSKKMAEKSYDNPLLLNKTWAVTQIKGEDLQYPNQADVAYLFFERNMSVHGFGGCNNYSGKYDVVGDSISFKNVGATMRLCPEQQIEDALFKAMNEAVTFKVTKSNLKLYDQRKRELINAIIIAQ